MTDVFMEEAAGESSKSFSEALSQAIAKAIAGYRAEQNPSGDHDNLKLTVIVDGYIVENGKYRVKVRVVIFDPALEEEKYVHKKEEEALEHLKQAQGLQANMFAATLGMHLYTHHDYHLAEELMHHIHFGEDIANSTESIGIENNQMTIVSSEGFHDILQTEAEWHHTAELSHNYESLTLGPGSGGASAEDKAA